MLQALLVDLFILYGPGWAGLQALYHLIQAGPYIKRALILHLGPNLVVNPKAQAQHKVARAVLVHEHLYI